MKLFAIITAGLMAVGGGVYVYSTSPCSKSSCALMPVAKTGGCCSTHDEPGCCSTHDESVLQEACSTIAASANVGQVSSCCGAKDECYLVSAARCTVEKAGAKPVEIAGCCEACVATPTLTVTVAAKSIAAAK